MKRTFSLVIILISTLYIGSTSKSVQAEETCDLSEKLEVYIETIKTPDYSDGRVRKELLARKTLLESSIDCAKLDVYALKESLEKSPENIPGNLRNNLLSSLDESLKYYDQKKEILNELGIQGIKDVAKEIYLWRESNFSILAKRVKNYLVWQENQDIFTKTEDRLKQINNLISSLKMTDDSSLQETLHKATGNLLNAKDENNKAKSSLERNLNSEDVLSSMKKSLEYLSSTYANFLEISDRISEIIPRTKK
jgi:hypothetical protein